MIGARTGPRTFTSLILGSLDLIFTANFIIKDSFLPEIIKEGISCTFCHSYTHLSPTVNTGESIAADAQYYLNPGEGIMYGPIQSPDANSYHQSEYNPIYHQSEICLPCHNLEIRDVKAEVTFSEWHDVTAGGMVNSLSCQSCHMPNIDGHHNHEFVLESVNRSQV